MDYFVGCVAWLLRVDWTAVWSFVREAADVADALWKALRCVRRAWGRSRRWCTAFRAWVGTAVRDRVVDAARVAALVFVVAAHGVPGNVTVDGTIQSTNDPEHAGGGSGPVPCVVAAAVLGSRSRYEVPLRGVVCSGSCTVVSAA